MSIDALRDLMPAYAKDISLNLGSLASETVLNDQQKWGCFLASAHAVGVAPVVKAIEAQAATVLSPEAMNAAKAAAAIMGMIGISEGAIPFAAADPMRVIPAIVAGGIYAHRICSMPPPSPAGSQGAAGQRRLQYSRTLRTATRHRCRR